MGNLTWAQARERADLIGVDRYRVRLDLRGGDSAEVTTFTATTTVDFTCRRPGESTFLDIAADEVIRIELNGHPISAEPVGERITLTDLAEHNTVVVESRMSYSSDGQGLHRGSDPADGRLYVYGHLFLDAAPRVFACFDQPDLKAPFDVTVLAPAGWTVLGNGAATPAEAHGGARSNEVGQWRLATTPPLATYFVTICAGPYVSVHTEHDGIPLGIHARASLSEDLHRQAGDLLAVTTAAFDYYHQLFGIRYPFGEYHQVFVPEFNAGAMENPGCVTIRDSFIFRGATTDDQLFARSNTIVHELAHMWFGDLVTMRWWDDLWLNESFAEYMAHRTMVALTGSEDPWVDFAMIRKTWGYAAERMPSTHPVAASPEDAADAESALQNFDGISYAKGAAVLRQLIAYVGDDAFVGGIRDYLDRHRFGSATLSDFLAAIETHAGTDLDAWATAWLRTAGRDVLSIELAGADKSAPRLTRARPEQHPASRPHRFDIAVWRGGLRRAHLELTLGTDEDAIDLAGLSLAGPGTPPGHAVIIPNAAELTWAQIRLDPDTVAALPRELGAITEPINRAAAWGAVIDGVASAEHDPRLFVDLIRQAWPVEDQAAILGATSSFLTRWVLPEYLPQDAVASARLAAADAAQRRLDSAAAGSTQEIAAARLLAWTTDDQDLLRQWRAGRAVPSGLQGDHDFRWSVVRALAAVGALDRDDVDADLDQDRTLTGHLAALTARSALPSAADKAWAWEQLTTAGRSNYEMNALATGFWISGAPETLTPYVPRYHEEIPQMARRVGQDALARVAHLAYPRTIVDQATIQATTERLETGGLSPAVRRAMIDQRALMRAALAARTIAAS